MRSELFAILALLLVGCDALPYELDLGGDEQAAPAKPVASAPVVALPSVATAAPPASVSARRKPPEPAPGPLTDITADAITAVTTSSEQPKFVAKNLFDHDPKTA